MKVSSLKAEKNPAASNEALLDWTHSKAGGDIGTCLFSVFFTKKRQA